MILEEQRFLHEDLERLEQAISDRVSDEPKQIRERLARDHQISGFLNRIQDQSSRLLGIYKDADGARAREIQSIGTGEPLDEFYKQLAEIKAFHQKYPNETFENLERAYKRKAPTDGDIIASEIDNMFTGEEAYGRFLDLTQAHEAYLNLPGIKRLTYLQYLETFDVFTPPQCPIKRADKTTDQYFKYVGQLSAYLEDFLRRTRPLEDLDSIFADLDKKFDKAWNAMEVPGWGISQGPPKENTSDTPAIWCRECEKEFNNENVYKNHLSGRKHLKASEAQKLQSGINPTTEEELTRNKLVSAQRTKERAIASRENRIRTLSEALQQERAATRVNVERRQGQTERERQQELDQLYAEAAEPYAQGLDDNSDSDGEEKVYNPLKLPLAWDGKPIPFWLYKLHGLGVEFSCEICGNFVYMGRRAFDKHFNEARHIYGLKCLGITNTTLFREITGIDDALKLWNKIQNDKKKEKTSTDNVVQMEDAEGNVMPEKVYYDLQKQGLL
ncbi:MAG: hypothetical protein M1829_006118 [Trizodia sp. TS-e1964]|nr:MAG: hypothetical protein M1829_006118 [Trizodia sp. TS-e1964]